MWTRMLLEPLGLWALSDRMMPSLRHNPMDDWVENKMLRGSLSPKMWGPPVVKTLLRFPNLHIEYRTSDS